MYAIPKPGRSVPIPGTNKLLPATGQNIGQVTQYWQRRLLDGDITLSETLPVAAVSPAKETVAPAVSAPANAAAEPPAGNAGRNPSKSTRSAP